MKVIHVVTEEQYALCLEIRRKVFIEEQGVPEDIEVDAFEQVAENFLLFVEERPVATGRFRVKGNSLKFERLATLIEARGKGYGKTLMLEMQQYACEKDPHFLLIMHAQISAVPFYKKLGWKERGEVFQEADIDHQVMFLPPE